MGFIDRHETIGRLVAEAPLRARVFEKYGIDYCCGGHRPLDEVASERGLDIEALIREVDGVTATGDAGKGWLGASDAELIDHILKMHHEFLHDELPALASLVEKVAWVHRATHPELAELKAEYDALAAELGQHMMKEEQVLFPMLRMLSTGNAGAAAHCGGIGNPLRVMRMEHEGAGQALARIRKITCGFAVPADACNSYRSMLARLEFLEQDLHDHIHKEENILFPRFRPAGGN